MISSHFTLPLTLHQHIQSLPFAGPQRSSLQRNVNIHKHVILIGKFLSARMERNFHSACMCAQFECGDVNNNVAAVESSSHCSGFREIRKGNLHGMMVHESPSRVARRATRSQHNNKGGERSDTGSRYAHFVEFMQIGVDS